MEGLHWNGLTQVWSSLKHKLLCHFHVRNNVRDHTCGRKAVDPVQVASEAGKERNCIKIVPKKTYGMSAWEFFQSLMKETDETEAISETAATIQIQSAATRTD